MEKYSYEMILDNILEAKNAALIILDLDLNIVYLSDIAEKIIEFKNTSGQITNIRNYFDEYDSNAYEEIIRTETVSDKKIVRLNSAFYISTLSPLKENGKLVGIIEILEAEDENYVLSYEIKDKQMKAYEKSQFDNKLNMKNGTVYTLDSIITNDEEMKKLIDKAKKTADSNSPILIYGETGTGKELFAQGIHNASNDRRNNMFIAQNCAAIPETLLESLLFGTTSGSFTGAMDKPGLFEIAKGGTIYLDEINSMNLNLQAKLLRVLQENTYMPIGGKVVKKADVRIIASFNEDPISVIKKGKFRRDLYYRLNVIYFKIPTLKYRSGDIKLLTNNFINLYNKKFNKNVLGIKNEAMDILENSNWEGNVRELKNNIERMMNFIDGDYIKIEDISNFIIKEAKFIQNNKEEDINYQEEAYEEQLISLNDESENSDEDEMILKSINNKEMSFKEKTEEFEKRIIKAALNDAGGNVSDASRKLELPRQTLKNKMVKYNIKPFF
jgi:arginine utilization regulatory protein